MGSRLYCDPGVKIGSEQSSKSMENMQKRRIIKINQTSVAQKEMNQVIGVAQRHLAQLSTTLNTQRCTLLPAVHDLLSRLTLPDEAGGSQPGSVHPPGGVPINNTAIRGPNSSKLAKHK